ncbi:MAG: beta-mannosidase [Gordonia sp. (in: high G+C Gram-positive bacteria)]
MTRPHRWALLAVAVVTAFLLAGSALLWTCTAEPAPAPPQHTVAASGTSLTLDGKPWWPTGFNAYQLATDWTINVGCGAQVDLDAYFSALPPRSLTRFALFAPFTHRKQDGTVEYASVDAVFATAARHRQLVLPVLAAGDGACDGEQFRTRDWYADGWRSQEDAQGLTYLDWVRIAVERWRDEPALAGWTPIGEPETSVCGVGDCRDWRTRLCPAGGAQILRTFFDDAGGLVKSLDPHHLVFSGTAGGDQCGTAGSGMETVGASPGVDVLEYHFYKLDGGTPPTDSPTARIGIAQRLRKPLVLTEIGWDAGRCRSAPDRAARIRSVIGDLRRAGVAGALAWAYVPDPRPHLCTYDIGPHDPLWPRLVE